MSLVLWAKKDMPRIDESKKLSASITIKMTKADHDLAQALADRRRLPLAEWAREQFLKMLGTRGASPAEHVILAEIIASSQALVDLLMAVTSREALPLRKAQEIVDATHARKYQEAAEMFKCALSHIEPRSHQ